MKTHPKAANDNFPVGSPLRYQVQPRDVSPFKAARILGLTLVQFEAVRPRLELRGFPLPDPDTAQFDSKAIHVWQDKRSGLSEQGICITAGADARTASDLVMKRLASYG